ncbi:hypothetical protein [Streptomyces mirabilis]|uniref:hypothetical protein n=1 Tax=Streptomyces mirabilis TaxID=68239 RepID=UPI0037D9F475
MARTLFADVDNSMRIAQEEILRPDARGHPLQRRRPRRQRLPLRTGRRLDRQSRALDIARNVRTGTFSINGVPFSVGLGQYVEYMTIAG